MITKIKDFISSIILKMSDKIRTESQKKQIAEIAAECEETEIETETNIQQNNEESQEQNKNQELSIPKEHKPVFIKRSKLKLTPHRTAYMPTRLVYADGSEISIEIKETTNRQMMEASDELLHSSGNSMVTPTGIERESRKYYKED